MKSLGRGAVGLALACNLGAAAAASTPADTVARFLAARRAAAATAPAAAATPGRVDHVPPVLTGLTLRTSGDAALSGSQIRVRVQASDDLSGVQNVTVVLQGPHGQLAIAPPVAGMPAQAYDETSAIDLHDFSEPGSWTLLNVTLEDSQGNTTFLSGGQVAGIGDLSVRVTNHRPGRIDMQAPTLLDGKVLTHQVSLSAPRFGTNQGFALAGADFRVRDGGDPVASGPAWVTAYWCQLDGTTCFSTTSTNAVGGLASLTLRTQGIPAFQPVGPGTYLLDYLGIADQAGNYVEMQGTDFGGATDFSVAMPGGHQIVLVP